MAYHIRYDQTKNPGRFRAFLLTACFFALFLAVSHLVFAQQLLEIRQLIFPQAALDSLCGYLQQSGAIGDAVAAFCQDYLVGHGH